MHDSTSRPAVIPARLTPENCPGSLLYVSLLGFGDTLISLQLLNRVPTLWPRLRLIGTSVTSQLVEIFGATRFPVTELLADHAAFFRVKTTGAIRALAELRAFRHWARQTIGDDDRILFEKPDWRNRLMLGRRFGQRIEPKHSTSIYTDRKQMLEQLSGAHIKLEDCAPLSATPRRVVLHPAARLRSKELSLQQVEEIGQFLGAAGCVVTLIDPDRRYSDCGKRLHTYLPSPPLPQAIAALRGADLLIAPDSFFMHLAYYYRVPFFALPADSEFYFAPPGCRDMGNYLPLREARNPARLRTALMRFFRPA